MAELVSGMTGALQGTITSAISTGQSFLDRIFPPETRNELWAKLSQFATEKPLLASFILSQVALTGVPLGLFAIMTITVVVFSLLGALLIGLLGALVFIVVAVGFALLILLPVLFVTTFAAAFIWLWGVGGYYIIKWFNQKEIPGIHTPFKSGLEKMVGLEDFNGEQTPNGAERQNGALKEEKQHTPGPKKPSADKKAGSEKKDSAALNGTVNKVPGGGKVNDATKSAGLDAGDPKKAADVGKTVGKTGDLKKVTGVADGVL